MRNLNSFGVQTLLLLKIIGLLPKEIKKYEMGSLPLL
jgi:hypothetical protein